VERLAGLVVVAGLAMVARGWAWAAGHRPIVPALRSRELFGALILMPMLVYWLTFLPGS
jgi:hypothetical protein